MPLPYTLREGIANFKRAKFAALASTSATAVALIMIGTFLLTGYHFQIVIDWIKGRAGEVVVYLEDADEPVQRAVAQRIQVTPGVADVAFVSREQAMQEFIRDFGDEGEVFMDETFLPASVKVRVENAYAQPDSLDALVARLKLWNRVDDVVYNAPLLAQVQRNLRFITTLGLGIGLVVLLASLFLVANTIRLTIYARRLLIRTMKLVGATDRFVRRPFLVEGILQGALAGLLAGLFVWGLHVLIQPAIPGGVLTWPGNTPLLTVAFLITFGALLGWLGSLISVRRFIKHIQLS